MAFKYLKKPHKVIGDDDDLKAIHIEIASKNKKIICINAEINNHMIFSLCFCLIKKL